MEDRTNTSFTSRTVLPFSLGEQLIGLVALLGWVLAFTGGILVDTSPLRARILAPAGLSTFKLIELGVVAFTCYTVTNVALLCCLASLLGGLYHRAIRRLDPDPVRTRVEIYYMPYMIQGFVVYLLLVSGLLLLSEDPFMNLTQNKYIRLAGSASIMAFISGFNPRIFTRLLDRFHKFSDDEKPPAR